MSNNDIIELILDESQTELLAPIIRQSVNDSRNVLFVTVAPDPPNPWRLQVVSLPALKANKVIKAIQAAVERTQEPAPQS